MKMNTPTWTVYLYELRSQFFFPVLYYHNYISRVAHKHLRQSEWVNISICLLLPTAQTTKECLGSDALAEFAGAFGGT